MDLICRRPARAALAASAALLVATMGSSTAVAQAGAITPRGAASSAVYASETTTALTLSVPAGAQAGDVLIASLGFGSSVTTAQPALAPPAGWTLVSRVDQGVVGSLAVYWHVYAAGETAYTWTASVKVGAAAFVSAYGGVDTTNPIDASAGQVTIKSVQISATPVTTTLPNDVLVASYFGYRGNGGPVTWTPPAGMAEIGDATNQRSRSGCLDYTVQSAAGPSGVKTATASARMEYGIAVLTALRPASTAVDTTPPVITAVSAGSPSPSGATVSWATDEASDSQVEYGTTSSYGATTTLNTTLTLAHSQALSGLAPATTYHYRVRSRDGAGNLGMSADLTFVTAAASDTTPPVISGVGVTGVSESGATVGWSTDEASSSQVEYGTTSSYGSASALDSSLVQTHSVALTGLTAGRTYHYRVRSRDAAGNLATSGDLTFTTNTSPTGPVPIIVDTDIFSDADDVGALATAFAMQIRGEANVVAIGVNTRTSRPAVATNSWKCAAAVAQFYNSASVPIGTDMPNNGTAVNTVDFVGPCAQLASPSTPAPDTAANVFRRALVAQPNASVVMVAVGYEENLSNLLNSPPDSISPLSGRDLVSQKVKTLVVMGGRYPSGPGETNFAGNVAAAQDVATNWPTRVVYSGTEVGDAVHTGNTISGVHPANSPVRVAYEAFVGANNWIYSYDLTAVYHAVRPGDALLVESASGSNAIDSSGGNVFTTGTGNRYYLSLTNATSLDAAIEALLDTLPAPPPDTTPPVISGVSAGSLTASGAVISWATNEGSDSQVDYGLTTSYGSATSQPALVTTHSVPLSGLASGTEYHYRVKSNDAAGNLATSADFTFMTASAPPPGPNDNFDSNTIDASRWTVNPGGSTVAAANQELEITHPASTSWTKGSIQCAVAFDGTGRSIQLQVKRAANNGLGGVSYGETSVFLQADSTHYVEFFIAGGALTAWVNNGSGEVNLTPTWPRYSATTMQWLRFREAGGTIFWEYASGASDPGTWTVLASAPDPFPMTSVVLKIAAGSNIPAVDMAQFDNMSTS